VQPVERRILLDTKRRHTLYDIWDEVVTFLWRTYSGGREYRTGEPYMLDKYPRETDAVYSARRDRSYYLNFYGAVIDAYISSVYKRDPVREPAELEEQDTREVPASPQTGIQTPLVATQVEEPELTPAMQEFMEDATGAGHSLTRFIREQVTFSLAAERAFVVVDVAASGFPYCHSLHPANLLDFALDEDGLFLWALVAEKRVYESDPFESRVEEDQFRLWLPDEWFLFDSDAHQIEHGPNRAGRVPIVEIDGSEVNLPAYDIGQVNRRIYNLCSQLDEILINVTFPQMYAPGDGIANAEGTSISSDTTPIEVGTARMLLIPDEAKMAPGFLAPPDGPAKLHIEERERLIGAIYSLAGLERKDPDAQNPQSGVAKAYDFRETNARLVSLAQTAERAELEIFELVNAYGLPGEVNVSYSKDFNVRDFAAMLEAYLEIETAKLPAVVKKRAALDLSMAIAEEATEDEKKEIREAVEAMGDEDFSDTTPDLLSVIRPRTNRAVGQPVETPAGEEA